MSERLLRFHAFFATHAAVNDNHRLRATEQGRDREPNSYYWPCLERIARIIVNTPIQGSSANLLIRAIIYLVESLPVEYARVVNLVHAPLRWWQPHSNRRSESSTAIGIQSG
jgi:DNA polymerase I-like protein with 3'-5' exonuclease and polymerase domains